MYYFGIIFIAAFISFLLAHVFYRIANFFGIIDDPKTANRKLHAKKIPLLGGLGIYFSFFLTVLILLKIDTVLVSEIFLKNIVGIFLASTIIIIGGILDDKFSLKPKVSILFPIIAIVVVITSGIGITYISNPLGGIVDLTRYEFGLFWYNGTLFKFTLWADILTFVWILGMAYTTKILDGLDGLVSGITVIGAVILLIFSLSEQYYDPTVALLASILAGVFLGFLIMNWHPAKIFLGESGSILAGFLLGILAILSGSKIAIAALVMGIPILDLCWVILQRWFLLKRSPFRTADRRHLHFRLLDLGLSYKKVVLFYYLLSFSFGVLALFFQTRGKIALFAVLFIIMVFIIFIVIRKNLQKYGRAI